MDVHTIPTHLPRNNKQINNLSQKKSIKWTRIIWKMTTNTSDLYFNWYNSYSSTDTHNTPRFFLKKTRGKGTPEDLPSFIGGTNLKRGKEREEERERKGEQVKEMSHNLIRDNWEQSRPEKRGRKGYIKIRPPGNGKRTPPELHKLSSREVQIWIFFPVIQKIFSHVLHLT